MRCQTVFGVGPGSAPDRFFVALAVLSLLSDVAEDQPLICVVDDEQWLDRASAQVLAFVARRLQADSVGLVFAARGASDEFAGLPELMVEGLNEGDARALLELALPGPLDSRVRDQIVAETRGNPLALLELPQGLPPAELAGGFGFPDTVPLSGRIEQKLPAPARRAPGSDGAPATAGGGRSRRRDTARVASSPEQLGIRVQAATPAVEAGLIEFGARVRFRHPLVRSAAYLSASLQERQELHRALAEATDPDGDPDRRAWHRAHAAPGPDEKVASELERSAGRAQARGGLAAAAAFLERAATLTPEPARRAQRMLAAARAKRDAGAPDAALGLLVAVEAGARDALRTAEVEHLRGQIALDQQHGDDAARLLLDAARRLEPLNADLARETYLEALVAGVAGEMNSPGGALVVAEAVRAAPPGRNPPRVVDVVLDALALRYTGSFAMAAPALTRALELLLAQVGTDEVGRWFWLTGGRAGNIVAVELWDAESWHALAARQVQFARDRRAGAPAVRAQPPRRYPRSRR